MQRGIYLMNFISSIQYAIMASRKRRISKFVNTFLSLKILDMYIASKMVHPRFIIPNEQWKGLLKKRTHLTVYLYIFITKVYINYRYTFELHQHQ